MDVAQICPLCLDNFTRHSVFKVHPYCSTYLKFIPFSLCVCVCELLSCVLLFATPWTVAHQAPLYVEFSREEYWSGLPFPSSGDLPDSEIESRSPALQADYTVEVINRFK